MHGKEHVMQPMINKLLGLQSIPISFDTDAFGTFTGEIERSSDPVTTLRKKIIKGLEISGHTLGIGNEGSFGPHPEIPLIPCDQEIAMMIDLQNNIEIMAVVTSTETNHAQQEIHSVKDLIEFATEKGFPRHALILKEVENGKIKKIRKGILGWELLYSTLNEYTSKGTKLIAETDMRAHVNPTRMKVIEKATESLLKKVANTCPECQWPGFASVETKRGLPCSQCGSATRLVLSKIYQCKSCDYVDERFYTSHKADPQYCDHCNP